jgi:DNA mismatch repair ATPase MutS
LAQTFGITPAENVVMTPFAWIHTHMNIVDNPEAGESRFMAEALRAISIFDMVKACKDNEFCFIIIDEMFSGTEPIPGEECAFAFAEELARHRNSMSVIATHYRYLTMLPEQTNGAFKNYKVSVNRLENGALEFPYKLATGIADTNIALDILRLKLKDRGYETGFLNNAQMRVNQRRARG